MSTAAVPNDKHNQLSYCTVSEVLLLLRSVTINIKILGVKNGMEVRCEKKA